MGRVLLYPLLGLTTAAILAALIAAVVVTVARARAREARRRARWEAVTWIKDGNAIVGVRLVARWGNHRLVLKEDPETETIPFDYLIGIIEAQGRAQQKAITYNDIEKRNQK